MNTLSNIRYLLFAIVVLGAFSNFAQNEFGLTMMDCSHIFIAVIFFIEAIHNYKAKRDTSKSEALRDFSEHFWIGVLFLAFFFRAYHWKGTGILFISGTLALGTHYLLFSLKALSKENRVDGLLYAVKNHLFGVLTLLAVIALTFKLMRFPGSNMLLILSSIFTVLFVLISSIKRTNTFQGKAISLRELLLKMPGKMTMVFIYFGGWVVYFTLISFDLAPGFYDLKHPAAYYELRNTDPKRAEILLDNYNTFVENREKED